MSAHLSNEQLDALAEGKADATLDAHLASCPACRQAVAQAKGLQRLLGGVKPYTLSDMAFRRVEAKLMEQVEEGLPSRWPAWLTIALPVAVAALALVVWAPWRTTAVDQPRPTVVVQRPAPKTFLPMIATFTSADAKVRVGDEAWRPLRANDEVKSGAALAGGRAVLASAGGLVLEAEGSLAVGGQAMVVLGAGLVGLQGDGEVLAGTRRVMSVDAAYLVERTAAEVVLEVARGDVEVFDESTAQRRAVKAPARLRWADGTALDRAVVEPVSRWTPVVAPKLPGSVLDLSGLPDGTTLSVDGQLVGTMPFTVLLEAGRHRLELTPPGKPALERFVDLVGGQPFVFTLSPDVERPVEAPEPDAKAIARVLEDLRRQTPKLRSCYEKWLKANPSASGTVDLVLLVSAKGQVKKADVKGDPISAESVACLKTTAKTLVLSPLGSEQELEVPLVLTPGKR